MIGRRFFRLVVVARSDIAGSKATWICRCDCGEETTVRGSNLISGNTSSCGCLRHEASIGRFTKHGASSGGRRTREYRIWSEMVRRCHNPSAAKYSYYGGRGVTVCDRWRYSFENFLSDMGQCEKGLTLERTDNDCGYSPANCRWATRLQQANNRRSNRVLEFDGKRLTVAEWARLLRISSSVIYSRLARGKTVEESLVAPGRRRVESS